LYKTEWASVVREAKAYTGKKEDNLKEVDLKEVGPRALRCITAYMFYIIGLVGISDCIYSCQSQFRRSTLFSQARA
jgi:hypothetical protein